MSSTISPSGSSSASPVSANTLITSSGIGSGLNIGAIVSSLTSAFGAAQTNQLSNRQSTLDSQVSAYGTFTSALDTLKLALPQLEDAGQLAGFTATVADKTIATATTSSAAVAGQYTLLVNHLATAATLTSAPLTITAPAVGTGTLTIAVGNTSSSITIGASNNSLADIAAAINSAPDNPGVSASIITTTEGSRLVLTGTTTGVANVITVTPSGGDGGLTSLAFTQTTAPQDASFSINAFPATSASNVVSNAITGVTLNLQQASAANTPTTLTISPDTSSAQTAIDKFVTAVNGALSSIRTLTAYDPSTQTAGPLNGNATLEAFQNQLQSLLGQVSNGSAGVKSLTDLGLAVGQDGNYSIDDTKLGNALSTSLASIGNLLGGSNGIATKIANLVDGYTKPGGLLDSINKGLQTGLSSVLSQQSALAAQLAAYSARLTAQYNAMDTAVALLKQTQTYLNAEFNPGANSASSSSSGNSSLGSGNLGVGG